MGNKNRKAQIQAAAERKRNERAGEVPSTPMEAVADVILDEVAKKMDEESAARIESKEIQEKSGDAILEEMNKEAEKSAVPLDQSVAHTPTTAPQPNANGASALPITTGKLANRKRKSEISSPVKTVWHIADAMKANNAQVRRKDVVAACVAQGIATLTAKTQYQLWFAAHKADAKPAPVAAPAAVG